MRMSKRLDKAKKSLRTSTERKKSPAFPFTAIVGQEEMKLALLLNVIDPTIGGVLIMGHRGTGKSTAVRALADLLPPIKRVRGCLYGCDPAVDEENLCDDCESLLSAEGKLKSESFQVPVVDLPLGATEDRVCGTINIERALTEGRKTFEPGLLARANRGFLYIDEVNLLEDHLIDLLLDVAVTGRNVVEREGISIKHPARFVLIGSGNPEEGELRPQLQDRFGLSVEVRTEADLESRVRIVEQREAFERNPAAFRSAVEAAQQQLLRRLVRARKNARNVRLSPELLRSIAQLCSHLKIDGHRGELTITRTARALAALEGRLEASAEDVRRVAPMSLRHRLRRDPLDQNSGNARIEDALEKLFPQNLVDEKRAKRKRGGDDGTPSDKDGASGNRQQSQETENDGAHASLKKSESGSLNSEEQNLSSASLETRMPKLTTDHKPQSQESRPRPSHSARRQSDTRRSIYNTERGRYARSVTKKSDGAKIALDATLHAGVGDWGLGVGGSEFETQSNSSVLSPNPQPLTPNPRSLAPVPRAALRYKLFKRREGTLYIFAVDASGSMALNRISLAKGALTRLLEQSYIRRDRVALVSLRGERAEVLMPPGQSVARARRLLDSLAVGGATPLASGLSTALELGKRAARRGAGKIVTLIFTDGRANVLLQTDETLDRASRQKLIKRELEQLGAEFRSCGIELIVVDTQQRFTSNGEARALASLIGGRYTEVSPASFSSTVQAIEI